LVGAGVVAVGVGSADVGAATSAEPPQLTVRSASSRLTTAPRRRR
jgi:hypothetical protein